MRVHVTSVHEKKKSFQCGICDYRCSQKGNLDLHIAFFHYKAKPFKCNVCEKRFPHRGNLNRHVSSVHEGKGSLM